MKEDGISLRDSINFLEANITLMKFNADPALRNTILAMEKVVTYAKEQYSKQTMRELADVMRKAETSGGGGSDGRAN